MRRFALTAFALVAVACSGGDDTPPPSSDATVDATDATDAEGETPKPSDTAVDTFDPASGAALDKAFGMAGVTCVAAAEAALAHAVALQPDGSIVVAGEAAGALLVRLGADGNVDMSFGTKGLVDYVNAAAVSLAANAVAVLPDGKLLVGGVGRVKADAGTVERAFLARFASDGTLDATFGSGGLTLDALGRQAAINALAVVGDKIWIAGIDHSLDGRALFARFTIDGAVDGTFAPYRFAYGPDGPSTANAMTVQPDGKILVAGSTTITSQQFGVARFGADGKPDMTFGTNGVARSKAAGGDTAAYGVAVQKSGAIVLAGESGPKGFTLMRFTAAGVIDATFGDKGWFVSSFGVGADYASSVLVDPDDRIVVGGENGAVGGGVFGLERYTPDGAHDTTFGAGGLARTNVTGDQSFIAALARQPDGKLVAAGTGHVVMGATKPCVARYLP